MTDLPKVLHLSSLNDRQQEAVLHTEGPLIVLAGAGSGKTKMLTSRIAHLILEQRVPPYQILAVTFTNKAAAEMRERVDKNLEAAAAQGQSALGRPDVGTFHSICIQILRREIERTAFTKPFVIYDDSDQLTLIKSCMKELQIDDKSFSPKAVQGAINRAKCDAREPADLEVAAYDIMGKQVQKIYELYQKNLTANHALDFGEIICLTYRLLRDNADLREKYQRRYRYIHVDEYQDTNRAQYLLLSQLASPEFGGHKNICVVGDEDQSIYKWRGADIRNILDFEGEYSGAKLVKLEQNYRSTKTILAVAGHVIRNNQSRKDKTLWTDNEQGALVVRAQLADERAEAEMVVSEIKKLAQKDQRVLSDFAIFYRTNAQSRQFEDVLRRDKLAYQVVGGLRFYDRKEIKDILSYFRVILNPFDSVSLRRVIHVPSRGIGKTTLEKLEQYRIDSGQPVDGVPQTALSYWSVLERAAQDPSITNRGTCAKIAKFVALIQSLMNEQPKLLLSELYHRLLDETGYVLSLKQEGTEEAASRVENLEELDTVIQEFEEDELGLESDLSLEARKALLLSRFIEQSSLASDADKSDPQVSAVKMMTLHSSKGLEFPVVFLVGMEDGLFPSTKPWEPATDEDIEEERRLCYVGMTRAREVLYLMGAVLRRIWGQVSYQEPSRFFTEVPEEYLDFRDFSVGSGATQYRTGSSRQLNTYAENVIPIRRSSGSSLNSSSQSTPSRGPSAYQGGPVRGGSYTGSSSPSFGRSRAPNQGPARGDSGMSQLSQDSCVGKALRHPEYGLGTVLTSEGEGADQKVMIRFGRTEKKFLLRYVRSYFC